MDRSAQDQVQPLPDTTASRQARLPKPAPCPVLAENIPQEMRDRRQWVCWRWTWKPPTEKRAGKWDKPPSNARTRRLASTTDSETWSSFEEALAAYDGPAGRYDGIGYVFSGDADDFVGVDLDKCRDSNTAALNLWSSAQRACKHWANTAPEPRALIDALNSYAEVSPSQTGVKLIVRGAIPKGFKHGSVEVYRIARYFTITGHRLPGAPAVINEIPALADLLQPFDALVPQAKKAVGRVSPAGAATSTLGSIVPNVDQLIAACHNAANGPKFSSLFDGDISRYPSQSEAELALCGIVAFWSAGDAGLIDHVYRQSKLCRTKWDELRGQATYGQRTISAAIERCTQFYDWSRVENKADKVFTVGPIELVIKDVRRTPSKLVIGLEIKQGGIAVDLVRLTDSASGRRQIAKQIAERVADQAITVTRVNEVLGTVIIGAQHWRQAEKAEEGKRLYDILAEYVSGTFELQYIVEGGKVCCAPNGEIISRALFIERHLTNTVIQLAATASDAPRDKEGVVKRSQLVTTVERELKLLWGELTSGLGTLEEANLPANARAAVQFRQSIVTIWKKLVSMGLLRHSIGSGPVKGETVQLAMRNSLASRVQRMLNESSDSMADRWIRVQEGFEAYVRVQPGLTAGECRPLLAMRYDLAQQTGVSVPGVICQTTLRRLGKKFAAIDPKPTVPYRMTGGDRLAVLSSDLVAQILALPDESLVTEPSDSDSHPGADCHSHGREGDSVGQPFLGSVTPLAGTICH